MLQVSSWSDLPAHWRRGCCFCADERPDLISDRRAPRVAPEQSVVPWITYRRLATPSPRLVVRQECLVGRYLPIIVVVLRVFFVFFFFVLVLCLIFFFSFLFFLFFFFSSFIIDSFLLFLVPFPVLFSFLLSLLIPSLISSSLFFFDRVLGWSKSTLPFIYF